MSHASPGFGPAKRALAGLAVATIAAACASPVTVTPPPSAVTPPSSAGPPSPSAGTPASPTPTSSSPTGPPSWVQPQHDVAIRIADGRAEFYERGSSAPFVPRGVNYVYIPLANGDVTVRLLGVGIYDPVRTRADFGDIAAAGYNTVRIFLDHCSVGANCITSQQSPGLNPRYMDNVADLMAAARQNGLQVLFTSVDLPDGGGYAAEANSDSGTAFAPYRNSYYLTKSAVNATKRYWTDLLTSLRDRHAAFDAVLAWELVNEQWMFKDQPPLSLTRGLVTSATGTYDMANPAGKAEMVSDGLINYIAETRAAILALDPTALVTMGFFVPEIAAPDWYVQTASLLKGAALDFFDFHAYPGGASIARHAELFGMGGYSAKPIVMGEYGAFRHQFSDLTSGSRVLTNWVADSCAAGWDGWLYWAYYPAAPSSGDQTWGFTDEHGSLMNLLSPNNQPDQCVAVDVPSANLAFGKTSRASTSLGGQPPELAFDENVATLWNAGGGPRQWIEVDLGAAYHVDRIRLVVAQDPAGRTTHRLLVRGPSGSSFDVVKTFSDRTVDGQELLYEPAEPLDAVRYIRVETTLSPSWVAWREIQVFGEAR